MRGGGGEGTFFIFWINSHNFLGARVRWEGGQRPVGVVCVTDFVAQRFCLIREVKCSCTCSRQAAARALTGDDGSLTYITLVTPRRNGQFPPASGSVARG